MRSHMHAESSSVLLFQAASYCKTGYVAARPCPERLRAMVPAYESDAWLAQHCRLVTSTSSETVGSTGLPS
jgi:hypothetical protein